MYEMIGLYKNTTLFCVAIDMVLFMSDMVLEKTRFLRKRQFLDIY